MFSVTILSDPLRIVIAAEEWDESCFHKCIHLLRCMAVAPEIYKDAARVAQEHIDGNPIDVVVSVEVISHIIRFWDVLSYRLANPSPLMIDGTIPWKGMTLRFAGFNFHFVHPISLVL